MKMLHPTCGTVEVVEKNEDGTTSVRLESGEIRTVTTEWLQELPTDGDTSQKPA